MPAESRLKVSVAIMARGRCFIEAAALPRVGESHRILNEQIQEAATKRKTVEQAMDVATAEWNKVIAKYA